MGLVPDPRTRDCLKDMEGIRLIRNYHRAKHGEPEVGKLCKKVFEDDESEVNEVKHKSKKVTTKLPAGEIVDIQKLSDGTWEITQNVEEEQS